ncbi:MAG: hypothetical protein ACKOC5_05750 [Chloroflexota bacterium]
MDEPGSPAPITAPSQPPLVGVVGPCAAGKSSLINRLKADGYTRVRHIAQEHSYVAEMWKRITHPDILVFLQVSYPVTLQRRNMDWTEKEYLEQLRRLQHARRHADLVIDTDNLSLDQVTEQVERFLQSL